jgi:predicted amidohydrolase
VKLFWRCSINANFLVAVIFCNAGGPSEDYLGISQITVPLKGNIARLPDGQEATLYADLDMNIAIAAEETYKIRADLAKDEWHYDYRKATMPSST